jgi:YggT family protein
VRGIFNLLYLAATVYAWLIVARAVLSWMRLTPGSAVYRINQTLIKMTEPYLGVFRRMLPAARVGGVAFDWSPVVGLLVLFAAIQVLARL